MDSPQVRDILAVLRGFVEMFVIYAIFIAIGDSFGKLSDMDHASFVLTLIFTLVIGAGIGFYVARLLF